MKRVLVRYRVKPESVDENERLVKAVYAELSAKQPAGLRYTTLKAADGVTFFHLASIETEDGTNPLGELDAFKAFQKDLRARCDEPPSPADLSLVGAYGFFGNDL